MQDMYAGIQPLGEDELVQVVIETPAGSQNKYDYDAAIGLFRLDRPIHSALRYPCDYGFLPNTLARDGDPVDVALLIHQPTFPGCLIEARAVAVMDMIDEDGQDEKIVCVAQSDPRASHLHDLKDLPKQVLDELRHFFLHIKDLEGGKWAKVSGFRKRAAALDVIMRGVKDAQSSTHE